MSIEKQTATVFYAPTRDRRFFSKGAAINAEASALILKEYPVWHSDGQWDDNGRFPEEHEDIRIDNPVAYRVMLFNLKKLLKENKAEWSWILDDDYPAWDHNFESIKTLVDKKINEKFEWKGLDNEKRSVWAQRINDILSDEEIVKICERISNG